MTGLVKFQVQIELKIHQSQVLKEDYNIVMMMILMIMIMMMIGRITSSWWTSSAVGTAGWAGGLTPTRRAATTSR